MSANSTISSNLARLRSAHAQDGAVEEGVLSTSAQMEPGADLEQRAHAAAHLAGLRSARSPRQQFEQRALAGAIAPDDPQY